MRGNVDTARQSGFVVHSLGVTRTFKSIPVFKALLERERPDIVISAYPDTNAAALISSRLSRHVCPIIVTEHASIKDHFAGNPWYRRLMVRVFITYVYRLAAHVICVSKGLERQVVSFLRKKDLVSTIYNPVRFVDNGTRSNRSVCTRLLAVGRFSVQKDYLTLLKAVNIVRQHSPIHLQIVGGVQEAQEVQRLNEFIAENNMQKCVDGCLYR